ncbi:hypothetical protein SAMN05421771_2132 [Granulicella pectinivorans]|jgi:hypothetical protein|uniref:Uncharacterized protein n=1 Tax=Granulicella pectinivorans TaxID=474950 RepID=A0A1I6M9X5_9BACT|nr:hypothetical protein SAMN05421771_2132 [Granulicella pectinivorans]
MRNVVVSLVAIALLKWAFLKLCAPSRGLEDAGEESGTAHGR